MLFLVDYDRRASRLVSLTGYADLDRRRAEEERLALELDQRRQGVEREVVLLEAISEAALRKTHRRYFESWQTISTTPMYGPSLSDSK